MGGWPVSLPGSPGGDPGAWTALTQLRALRVVQYADQAETRKRCDGRLHDVSGWNMWS
jgi:hypothetical protein